MYNAAGDGVEMSLGMVKDIYHGLCHGVYQGVYPSVNHGVYYAVYYGGTDLSSRLLSAQCRRCAM